MRRIDAANVWDYLQPGQIPGGAIWGKQHFEPLLLRLMRIWKKGRHGRKARGGYGLPKVSLGPTMPNPSTPCGRATPETALQPFQE
jgi:hypothetical protein